jgi:hypothetical protein
LEFASRCVASLGANDIASAVTRPGPPVLADKLVAETAMLLHAVAHLQAGEPRIRSLVHELAAQLVPHARGESVQAALCLDPGHALDHAAGHVLLTKLGYRDDRFDALLTRTLEMGVAFGPERLPHRRLEQCWLRRVGGWHPNPPSAAERRAMADSLLGRPLDALRSGRLDLYAFTHAVMYASDLGERRAPLPRGRARVAADALAGLALAVQTEDADLAAELLMTWPMLGVSWHPAASYVFERLAEREDACGLLPGSSFDAQHHGMLRGEGRFAYERDACYHTVYVWGILCAATLRAGAGPPTLLPRYAGGRRGAAASLLELLDAPTRQLSWMRPAHTLDAARQDTLAPLLLAIVLRRAAGTGDLPRLRTALEIALKGGLVDAPAPLQAASVLRRSRCLAAPVESCGPVQSSIASNWS